jgi:hypothetical protein
MKVADEIGQLKKEANVVLQNKRWNEILGNDREGEKGY